jgi:hypothetical protein
MKSADQSKLAWCATFASLFACETKTDMKTAQRVARDAYSRVGGLSASAAVQRKLRTALTWPGEVPAEGPSAAGHADRRH